MGDDELVLGVARARLWQGDGWHGVRATGIAHVLALIERHGEFLPRRSVEEDPSWKQVIPYLVLRDGGRFFLMKRTRAGGDRRLHDRYTIGIGGHVNPEDGGVEGGLEREWREEIEADFVPAFRPVGLLNDDTDPVGAVHLGLVYEAEAGGRPVGVREVDKLVGAFASPEDVRAIRTSMETWSQLAFDHLVARR